jgi:inner membrane protein
MNFTNVKNSTTCRVLFIGFLILLLLIPMGMVESVIFDRSHLYRQATNEITASWGKEQLLYGPILTLPFVKTFSENGGWSYDSRFQHLRPETMTLDSHIETQIRYRGIYEVPVYIATVRFNGLFSLADVAGEEGSDAGLQLDEGVIQIPVNNSRSIKEPIGLVWDGEVIKLTPKWDKAASETVIFTAKLPAHLLSKHKDHEFEYEIKLAGSKAFSFISSAQKTDIKMNSNWASPSFFGIYLPNSRDISDDGFTVSWTINDLLADMGYSEQEMVSANWFQGQQSFGVNLIQPVDTYQVVTRAAKYAVLFISLTFLVYFFTELFSNALLHPIQYLFVGVANCIFYLYLFVGVANCIFYLLLLSLAEHINFTLAYFISSTASISLISLYSRSILKSRTKATIVFVTLSGLYTYLFVTLRSEGFALLIGSIGLFLILGVAMYLTRNIDWRTLNSEAAAE